MLHDNEHRVCARPWMHQREYVHGVRGRRAAVLRGRRMQQWWLLQRGRLHRQRRHLSRREQCGFG
jgi:hypothetical protein